MTAPVPPTPNVMPAVAVPPAVPAPAAAPVAPVAPPAPAPAAAPPAVAPAAAPPWGNPQDFDASRAWALIENLRADNADLKAKLPAAPAPAAPAPAAPAPAAAPEVLSNPTDDAATWRAHAVIAEAKTKAGDRFVDAAAVLALANIGDGSGFVAGNAIDDAKIAAALDLVATNHPALVKPTGPPGFTPNRAQGQPGVAPTSIDAQIDAARKSGNVTQAIALQQQKFAAQQK